LRLVHRLARFVEGLQERRPRKIKILLIWVEIVKLYFTENLRWSKIEKKILGILLRFGTPDVDE